ncbi:MAG: L,D-transpeptidase [Anaerolineae bacterium]|nr:L,D-transpeptidase [Anaerolineae bacterium]
MPGEPASALSRRAFLRSIGLIGLAAALARVDAVRADSGVTSSYRRWDGESLARIAAPVQDAFSLPRTASRVTASLPQDTIVRVRDVGEGEATYPNNNLWLDTRYGYLNAAFLQPIDYHLPVRPDPDLGAGRWAEVIVPFTDTYWRPVRHYQRDVAARAHYRSVFFVTELLEGPDGRSWYKVEELYQTTYILATHVRLLPADHFTPLSPDVPPEDKRLEADLTQQMLTAYVRDRAVWTHPISSGAPGWETPAGEFTIFEKRISSHLIPYLVEPESPRYYNLPGAPYVCYFTGTMIATHGCTWHNDYGRPVSHGCLNLPPEAARWVWRWTTPVATPDSLSVTPPEGETGTRIKVIGE